MIDISKISFWSEANYMKRSELCGSASLTLDAGGGTVTQTIPHNLGYIPFFEVYCDQNGNGIIWSQQKINLYTETSLFATLPDPQVTAWSTTDILTINLSNPNLDSGDRTVYWLIYLDWGNVSNVPA